MPDDNDTQTTTAPPALLDNETIESLFLLAFMAAISVLGFILLAVS